MALWWAANAVLFAVVIPAVIVLAQRLLLRTLRVQHSAAGIHRGSRELASDSVGLAVLDSTRMELDNLREMTGSYAGAVREGTVRVRRAGPLRRALRQWWRGGTS